MKVKRITKIKDDLRPEAAKLWFEKGKREYSSAVLNLKFGGFTDTICFLCQQSAEKILKGFLVFNSIKFEKRHDLLYLLKLCKNKDKEFSELTDDCVRLTKYYIDTRYPVEPPVIYSRNEAEMAINSAERILEFIKKKIKFS